MNENPQSTYQQYTRIVPAAEGGAPGVANIPAPGEFVYCAVADRPVIVIIGGRSVTMQAGDKGRIPDGFRSVTVRNYDENPVYCRFIVGYGDFDRQIVTGELITAPGVRGADGRFRADHRYNLPLSLFLTGNDEVTLTAGYEVDAFSLVGDERRVAINPDVNEGIVCSSTQRDPVFDLTTKEVKYTLGGRNAVVAPYYNREDGMLYWVNQQNQLRRTSWGHYVTESWDRFTSGEMVADLSGALYPGPNNNDTATSSLQVVGDTVYIAGRGADSDAILAAFRLGEGQPFASRSLDGSFTQGLVWVPDGTLIHFDTRGYDGGHTPPNSYDKLDPNTLEKIGTFWGEKAWDNNAENTGVWDAFREVIWFAESTIAFRDVRFTGQGWAQRGQCGGATLMRQTSYNTAAEITALQMDSGKWRVSGEVIRAALDFYFSRRALRVADGYLDHVFAVRFPADGIEVTSGGESFARAEYADNFTVTLPQVVTLTIDSDIPLQE